MLQDLNGKTVKVCLGVVSGWTDSVKGEVIGINDSWIKSKLRRQ